MIAAVIALSVAVLVLTAAVLVLWGAYQTSQDRLFAAWRDGMVIPAAERAVSRETPDEPDLIETAMEGLPPSLADFCLQYEGQEAQLKWAARARSLLRKHPNDLPAVFLELESPGPSWSAT